MKIEITSPMDVHFRCRMRILNVDHNCFVLYLCAVILEYYFNLSSYLKIRGETEGQSRLNFIVTLLECS